MSFSFSRRSLVIGAACAATTAARADDVEFVVVGAGSAGIAAARALIGAGRSVVVLEARDRIGGRAETRMIGSGAFDAGAQYIHWAERNPWTGIARSLGIRTEEEGGRPPVLYANGVVVPEEERGKRRRAFAVIDDLISAGASPDRSIAAATAGAPDLAAPASGLTLLTLGEEPDRVSAADYDQLWAGDDLVVPDGYGTLVARHGAGLPVRLGTPVRRIAWTGSGVSVETERGTVRARAAIVTVPIGVLQAGSIAFAPDLPASTRDAVGSLAMGAYTKVALNVDRAVLTAKDLDDTLDLDPSGGTTSFEMGPNGRGMIVAYLGGDYARRLCEAGEAAAIDHMRERLSAMFGAEVGRAVAGGALAGWWTDPWSRGSYSIAKPGRAGARIDLRRPVGDRIWLAGEASAGGGAMTVGGAYLEGARAAADASRRWPR